MRKIRTRRLLISAAVYRLHIMLLELVALRLVTGTWAWAVTGSLLCNAISTVAYINYHYWFARLVKLGVNGNDHLADRK